MGGMCSFRPIIGRLATASVLVSVAVTGLSLMTGCQTSSVSRSPAHPRAGTSEIVAIAQAAARRHAVDSALVLGVIAVESGFHPRARSHVGARGLMQLMPKTAASLARRLHWKDPDVTDPAFNVEAGTYYLAYLLRIFEGDEALALAAYNTGPARVKRWWRAGRSLPAYSRRYVAAVRRAKARYGRGAAVPVIVAPEHDRAGLRRLLREKLYGDRPDDALDENARGVRDADARPGGRKNARGARDDRIGRVIRDARGRPQGG